MKNKEKFAKEIAVVENVAVSKLGVPMACIADNCHKCMFEDGSICVKEDRFKDWANSKYVKPKKFTGEERDILMALPKAGWVAKDECGDVFLYTDKPEKGGRVWKTLSGYAINISLFSEAKFESVKWKDIEPTSREEILE